MMSVPPRALVLLADGSEEIETTAPVDILRRAGAHVKLASVEVAAGTWARLGVAASRGVGLVGDVSVEEAAQGTWDVIVVPGGMPGAKHIRESEHAVKLLQSHKGHVAAICAAPAVVLADAGILAQGDKATCHPAFAESLTDQIGKCADDRVAVTARTGGDQGSLVITSRGPGTAIEFSLALVALIFGSEKAAEVAGPMVVHDGALDGAAAVSAALA